MEDTIYKSIQKRGDSRDKRKERDTDVEEEEIDIRISIFYIPNSRG